MQKEEKTIVHSLTIPFILVLIMWAVMIIRTIGGYNFAFLGIFPQKWYGLPGIVTTPFIHGDFSHLIANSVPMLLLGTALFLFYRDIAVRILVMIWLFTGFWVWVGGREAWHIGASGIVYGLSAFILTSGIIRRHTGLLAMALVVVFLYGSLIWGIFPEFFPEENISWESHLFGLVAGVALAFFYRKEGPQKRKYSWELEEETEDTLEGESIEHDDNAYWNVTITDEEIKDIKRTYRRHDNP
ncbi:MAG: rhomboid family intramembrane serine protease [Bacteroidales bacterium]|nr:rhomboid family intramembrane serine protease [Bacteroidales bacterium]